MTRLPALSRLPALPPPPLTSGPHRQWNHLNRAWVEIGPRGWQAYPLPISAPGTPHIVEVEYPSDLEQTLSISLIEPNVTGRVGPIGLDSGIDVPAPTAGHKSQVRRHRLTCFPQTKTPWLLLVNRRSNLPAVIGK